MVPLRKRSGSGRNANQPNRREPRARANTTPQSFSADFSSRKRIRLVSDNSPWRQVCRADWTMAWAAIPMAHDAVVLATVGRRVLSLLYCATSPRIRRTLTGDAARKWNLPPFHTQHASTLSCSSANGFAASYFFGICERAQLGRLSTSASHASSSGVHTRPCNAFR